MVRDSVTFLMKKVERAGNFIDNLTRLPLGEVNSLLDSVQQLATVDFLEHEVELLLVFEKLDQLDDVRVALAMMKRLDLLEHPGASVAGNLVDNLYGVLKVRVEGRTGLDRGVSAFAEYLASQLVQFCNSDNEFPFK